jgi:hypothetical protein
VEAEAAWDGRPHDANTSAVRVITAGSPRSTVGRPGRRGVVAIPFL